MECRESYAEFKALDMITKDAELQTTLAANRAQVGIYAAAYNRNRALYDKSVANWEEAMKKQVELVEGGKPVVRAASGADVHLEMHKNNTLKDEEAVYSVREYIRWRTKEYKIDLPAYVGKTWWK